MSVQRRYYRGGDVQRGLEINELREMARHRLPNFVWEYLEGGAEDEATIARNRDAFAQHRWIHRAPVNVETRALGTTVFGGESRLPVAIGPTGFNGMLWKHGDIELARAAKAQGIPFTASTCASDSIDEIAKQVGGRLWFQLFVLNRAETNEGLIRRAENAGCEALLITVDAPILGNRAWNNRSYRRPMQLSLRSKIDVLLHVRWFFNVFLPSGLPGFGNLAEFLPEGQRSPLDGARMLGTQEFPALAWEDLDKIRERWRGKLVIKGVLAREDVARAVQLGADGIVLSNHGGRQLDHEVSALDVLPAIASEFGDKLTIMIDGGFRRGGEIAKALALGADMVLLGRAPLYGLAAGGHAGVTRSLEILREELDITMALLGCPSIPELGTRFLHDPGASAHDGRSQRETEHVLGSARARTG